MTLVRLPTLFVTLLLLAVAPVQQLRSQVVLQVFGGPRHDVFLGCINCEPSSDKSILNPSGRFGRCGGIAFDNLYCRGLISKYGSRGLAAAETSACGTGSSDPPVIVDENGNSYGRFSVATVMGHADSVCNPMGRFYNERTCVLARTVCESAQAGGA